MSVARLRLSPVRLVRLGIGGPIVVVLAIFPLITTDFFTSTVGVRSLWLAIAAASVVFLAAYGGLLSIGQTALYGVAGFTMANLAAADRGAQHNQLFGLGLGDNWGPWESALGGIVVATLVGLVFGAVGSRSEGIYFLMLTLALGTLVFYFFGQVVPLSGYEGVNGVPAPDLLGDTVNAPTALYYTALICSAVVYLLIRYIVRTPFGLTLQGIRDDPVRMRSLGYNVELHRTLAFGFGAFVAAIAGVLSVWYNTRISPGSIGLGPTIDVVAIAIVGGIARLEGAWMGAFLYTILDYAVKRWLGDFHFLSDSFNGVSRFATWFGAFFLLVILLSPQGLMGIWTWLENAAGRALQRARA